MKIPNKVSAPDVFSKDRISRGEEGVRDGSDGVAPGAGGGELMAGIRGLPGRVDSAEHDIVGGIARHGTSGVALRFIG